jgi:LPXTG-site transpeptidase (sortase) family protein
MNFRVRLKISKRFLRGTERFCFALGYLSIGSCAVLLAHTWIFQAYRSWAFEQQGRGETASLTEFLAQTASFSGPDDAQFVGQLGPAGAKLGSIGFQAPGERSVVGRIEIPCLNLKAMILEGVSQRTLALAVGHIPGTALPGKTGNVGLAGHRDTFFRSLAGIHLGDPIVLTTLDGSYVYRVKACEVVSPRDTNVLEDSEKPELTLVTCYPFHYLGPAPQRFIVHAARAGNS